MQMSELKQATVNPAQARAPRAEYNYALLHGCSQTLQQRRHPGLPLTLTLQPVNTPSPPGPSRSPVSYIKYKGPIAERALQNFWGNSVVTLILDSE